MINNDHPAYINVRMAQSFYQQIDPRRRQEFHDSQMIQEDHRAMANCPMKEINEQYNQKRFNNSPMISGEVFGVRL